MAERMVVETGSQNTIDAYGVLQRHAGEFLTIAEVAAELGVSTPKVTGGLVSLAKKEAVLRDEKEAEDKNGNMKTYKAFAVNPDFEVEFVSRAQSDGRLSDNAVRLLQYLQENPESEMTHAEIAEDLDWQTIQVVGAATALARRNLITKPEVEITRPDGDVKTLKVVVLTEEGRDFSF